MGYGTTVERGKIVRQVQDGRWIVESIDRDGVTYITGRRRFCEDAIGRTVFLTKEEAEKALAEMKGESER